MRNNTSLSSIVFILAASFIFSSCQKSIQEPTGVNVSLKETQQEEQTSVNSANSSEATQLSGVGYFDANDECNAAGQGADLAFTFTGDLNGCWYVFIDKYDCSPSGTYREEGRELFIGTYNGQPGEFWTTYKFEAKYEHCDGGPLGTEIFGRCQHPITDGSGTGVFEGVTGRVDMKDDIEAGRYPYRGHLQF
jgi:hypothetical protein